jgi:hypothetical protein
MKIMMKRFIVFFIVVNMVVEIPAYAMGTLQSNLNAITQWAKEKKSNAQRLLFCVRHANQCSEQEAIDARKWVIGVPIATIVTIAAIAGTAWKIRQIKRMKEAESKIEQEFQELVTWSKSKEVLGFAGWGMINSFYDGSFMNFFGKDGVNKLYKTATIQQILNLIKGKTDQEIATFLTTLNTFLESLYTAGSTQFRIEATFEDLWNQLDTLYRDEKSETYKRFYQDGVRKLNIIHRVYEVLLSKTNE